MICIISRSFPLLSSVCLLVCQPKPFVFVQFFMLQRMNALIYFSFSIFRLIGLQLRANDCERLKNFFLWKFELKMFVNKAICQSNRHSSDSRKLCNGFFVLQAKKRRANQTVWILYASAVLRMMQMAVICLNLSVIFRSLVINRMTNVRVSIITIFI